MQLRRASINDLPYLTSLERFFCELNFIGADPLSVHEQCVHDQDHLYWIVESEGQPAGYIILCGLSSANRSLELKRIAIAEPGRGLGRQALRAVLFEVFEKLGAHRLWLDAFENNSRALHLYRSLGFVQEGILRECVKFGDRYDSLVLMSMLESEYRMNQADPV